jgi:hypothetical protein
MPENKTPSSNLIDPATLALLKSLGLAITPHSDPSYGWGYNWENRGWIGPYPTQGEAVQAAFGDALSTLHFRSEAPFATEPGQLFRWDGQEWEAAKYQDGKLWHFTGTKENSGWEEVPGETSSSSNLAATPGQYSPKAVSTLGKCLRLVERVRPTPVLYFYLGNRGWLTSQEAHDLVAQSSSMGMGLYWDAYLQDGQGVDPAGIYLFATDGTAWRAFAIEGIEQVYQAQRSTIHVLREDSPEG